MFYLPVFHQGQGHSALRPKAQLLLQGKFRNPLGRKGKCPCPTPVPRDAVGATRVVVMIFDTFEKEGEERVEQSAGCVCGC
jgi:hypothetical protein